MKHRKDVELDRSGFFVIHTDNVKKTIVVEHYTYDRKVRNKLIGKSAKELCDTLLKKGRISDLSHAIYMGRELMKAEMAIEGGLKYKQDKNISSG